jgi:hypothetical protein
VPQKDYIERAIEGFFEVLRQILGLEQLERHVEAQELLQRAAQQYLGLSLAAFDALSFEAVVRLLSAGGSLDVNRCLMLAELRRAQAAIQEGQGLTAAALATRIAAIRLYAAAVAARGTGVLAGRKEGVGSLLEEVRPYEVPEDVHVLVWRLLLATGDFARAEDALFALMEGRPDDLALVEEGRAAYEALLERPDAELEAGGLPRGEVEEALARLGA